MREELGRGEGGKWGKNGWDGMEGGSCGRVMADQGKAAVRKLRKQRWQLVRRSNALAWNIQSPRYCRAKET